MRAGDIAGVLIAAVLLPLAAACGPAAEAPSSGPGSEWQGTIETAGDVTTVVSQSGSVWGGTARLVEELSIGVQAGEPEYMLGVAATIWDDGDRIYYPDVSVPAVRVYDGSGVWLGDVGREGQGPGEYRYPYSVLTLDDGRIVASSAESNWVDLFSPEPDFEHLERWGFSEELSAAGARLFNMLVLGVDGTPYVRYLERDPTTPDVLYDLRQGWRSIGPDRLGPVMWIPRFEYEEYRNCYEPDCSRYGILQFAPAPTATLTPEAAVVAGIGDEYRFEIHHPDGTTTVVRREYEPVALSDEERDYWMARERAEGLMRNPDYRQSWSVEMPRVKPAFERLIAARDGRILVVREGPSRRVEPCTEEPRPEEGDFEPCWASTPIWDFFGAEGRYLGQIEPPDGRARGIPFIEGERFTTAVEDRAGTIRIKRYRLAQATTADPAGTRP